MSSLLTGKVRCSKQRSSLSLRKDEPTMNQMLVYWDGVNAFQPANASMAYNFKEVVGNALRHQGGILTLSNPQPA